MRVLLMTSFVGIFREEFVRFASKIESLNLGLPTKLGSIFIPTVDTFFIPRENKSSIEFVRHIWIFNVLKKKPSSGRLGLN